jgi:hypothetical protein
VGLCYARVQKEKKCGGVAGVQTEIVFGEPPAGKKVSTS